MDMKETLQADKSLPLKPCQEQTVQLMLKEGEVGYDLHGPLWLVSY